MTPLLFHTALITTALILISPILWPPLNTLHHITRIMKMATITSLAPLMIFMNAGLETITTHLTWTDFNLQISFMFDQYATMFLPIALYITWSILEFTKWYMSTDPKRNTFAKYLLLFLIAMMTLTTTNNMIQLFAGWEGVGIMSFLLIGWWHARPNAVTSAMQAVIYNRIGDIGMILAMAWCATNMNSWNITHALTHTPPMLPLLGFILAAAGKSAQFGLHPWLPAAMEGPTPVSALLHSSTMVVAGVFLLIRLHPLLETNSAALTTCLCLGAITTTFAAFCAITQNDIKKIIAFSTSSQLGLMMLTIGMNQPKLAFLHITTHAFFKAMLFLCSGSIIHNLNNEQDIRKMGGLQNSMPTTSSCLTLGCLALAGTPFLAGFYTKDTIIEAMNTSSLNAWALTITMTATALTAAYSLRLIFYSQLSAPRYPATQTPNEDNLHQTRPIVRLAIGSIFMGLLMTTFTMPEAPQTMTMPTETKLSALLVTLLGLIVALDLAHQTTNFNTPSPSPTHTITTQLGFYNTLTHRHTPNSCMKTAQTTALQLKDLMWYETLMPMGMTTINRKLTILLARTNTGLVKTHLTAFLALFIVCMGLPIYGTR